MKWHHALIAAALLAPATFTYAQVVVDGTRDAAYGAALSVQQNTTESASQITPPAPSVPKPREGHIPLCPTSKFRAELSTILRTTNSRKNTPSLSLL